jgi:EAL domain-containing protein (putative c-di-GMP-specific phosphodiesterase class I)/DNA-binding NarL/FixJ family response regulator
MKILLIDDDPSGVSLLRETLNGKAGSEFNLIHCPSLPNALQDLSEEEVDVVLLNLNGSETGGLDSLAQVQSAVFSVPIVVLAGPEDETTGLKALRLGAQDYLIKNQMDQEALIRTLRCAVERNQFSLLLKDIELDNHPRHASQSPLLPQGGNGGSQEPVKGAQDRYSALDHAGFAEILENERVLALFQPWVSLKEQSIVGFEGLCRGLGKTPHSLISPSTLLRFALHHRLSSALDRLFRRKVFEGFQSFAQSNPDQVLSVNFATPSLDDGDDTEEDFLSLAEEFQLDPSHIAIEILESHAHDPSRLKKFIQKQRSLGFLIALDDIGAGYSGLNRIVELKPDLIKIDRYLVAGIQKEHHQQEVFKSVVKLAHGIGAMTIAEGVETEDELMLALQLGTDMIQGFYFSKPGEIGKGLWADCRGKIHQATKKFRSYISGHINAKRTHYGHYDEMIRRMTDEMSAMTPKQYNAKLKGLLGRHPEVERLFVLDDSGAQLSHIVGKKRSSPALTAFLRPSRRGINHSAMDYYYYHIESGFQRNTFVTEPFLSTDTGARCVTVSALFKNTHDHTNVLCLDVKME